MANRLTKQAEVHYTPAVPYQPAVPAYCVSVPYTVPGYTPMTTTVVQDQNGEYHIIQTTSGEYVPPHTLYRRVCFPEKPAVQGTPETVTYTDVQGWNGGARSVAQLDNDGYAQFSVGTPCAAVVCGFSPSDFTTLPSEQTHAIYVHGTVVQVMEHGTVVHTASISHAASNVYKIDRRGLTITYSCGAWSYTSALPVTGAVVLDASLYSTLDYIDNPTLVEEPLGGNAACSLLPLEGSAYDDSVYGDAAGSLRALAGAGEGYIPTVAAGSLQSLRGAAAEGVYTYAEGGLAALTGAADGGFPQVVIVSGQGAIPPLAGVSLGVTGEIGQAAGGLAALSGYAADAHGYAEAVGTLRPLQGYADSGWPVPTEVYETDVFLLGDFAIARDVQIGRVSDGLNLADSYLGATSIDAVYVDALLLDDSLTLVRAIEATITSGMLLGNDVAPLLQLALEPTQYAVNALSGALTTYTHFGFDSFTRANQQLYGAMADGVYRVRAGSDNGAPITAAVDFGQLEFGGLTAKSIETVYLGLATDGQVYVRMCADNGLEHVFMARERGPSFRVNGSKRVAGRRWNITLEVVDATDLALDAMEYCVFDTHRRWTSLR